MALIKCPECGKMVSDRAEKCPHCGFSVSGSLHCEECNYALTNTDAVCPECGHPAPWSRKCPDCGNYVLPTEEACPECGCDMELHFGGTAPITPSPESTKVVDAHQAKKLWKRKNKSLILTLVIIGILFICGCLWLSSDSAVTVNNIAVTNGNTTENFEIGDGDYKSGEGYNCGTFFYASIEDYRGTKLFVPPQFALMIKCPYYPDELKKGDDITNSFIEYYNFTGLDIGHTYNKSGSVIVEHISNNRIILKFDNFNFYVKPTAEKFGLNGSIKFRLEK